MQVMNQFNSSSLNFKSRSDINSRQDNPCVNSRQITPLNPNSRADQISFSSKRWILTDVEKELEPNKLARIALNKMETTPLATILDSIHEQTDPKKLSDTISEMKKQCNEPSMASFALGNMIDDYLVNRPNLKL